MAAVVSISPPASTQHQNADLRSNKNRQTVHNTKGVVSRHDPCCPEENFETKSERETVLKIGWYFWEIESKSGQIGPKQFERRNSKRMTDMDSLSFRVNM